MPYSADSDLLKEFSNSDLAKLTGDPSGSTIDAERTAYARQNADALIDAYLYGRYSVPFTSPVDPIIKKLSIDLTVVNLYDYAYRNSSLPNAVVWRKLNGVKLLKEIRAGNVALINSDFGTDAPPPIIAGNSRDERFFSDEKLDVFWNDEK